MAKITPAAVKHAHKLRASATRKGRRHEDLEEELGDIFGDLLGGLPIIGGMFKGGGGGGPPGLPGGLPDPMSLLGGIFGGGGGGAAPPGAPPGAMGPAPGMVSLPMPAGPTLEQIRSVVQDALAGNRDIVERMQLQQAGGDARLSKATTAVTSAIVPELARARGGVQVQRLQSQATSEHRGLTAQADRERLQAARHAELLGRLDRIARVAGAVQQRLGVGTVVTDPRTRNILNVR